VLLMTSLGKSVFCRLRDSSTTQVKVPTLSLQSAQRQGWGTRVDLLRLLATDSRGGCLYVVHL